MKSIFRNLSYVLRRFRAATILNIFGLSVAFAAFMIIMMQVDYDNSFDKFHKDVDQIYRIDIQSQEGSQSYINRPISELIFACPQIESGALHRYGSKLFFSIDKNGDSSSFLENTEVVEPAYTSIFHFDMIDGTDKALAQPMNVLLPQSLAQKFFGNESAVGKQLKEKDGDSYTVGGVYKDFPKNSTVSNIIYAAITEIENKGNWQNWNYTAYVKMKNASDADAINAAVKAELKKIGSDDAQFTFLFTPLTKLHFDTELSGGNTAKTSKQTVMVLFAIAFVIVIIAAINFTNFSMALAPMRIKSINMRKVLGCSATELRLLMISEGIVLSIVAYLLALLIIYVAANTPVANLVDANLALNQHILLVAGTGIMALLTGLVSGIYPSFYVTSFEPAVVLKGSFGQTMKGRKLRNVLISIQFVASFVLFFAASFMYLQNRYLHTLSLGYDKDQLIVTDLSQTVKDQADVFRTRCKSFAGIEGVSFGESLLSGGDGYMGWGRMYKDKDINFQCLPVDPSFLNMIGVEVTDGRNFREDDKLGRRGKFIFNEKAKKEYDIELNSLIDSSEVIGFIPDIKYTTLRIAPTPMAFYVWGTDNWGNRMSYAYIKVSAGSDMGTAMEHVKSTLKSIDPEWPFNVRFYDDVLNDVYQKEERLSLLITLFGIVAILISIIGVFGLVIFENEYRQKEISIRKVLGSSVWQVLTLFNKSYLIILTICFAIACPIAYYAVNMWLANFAFHTPIYWWVFLLGGLVVFVITIATVSWQSWQAANSNPVDKLKNE